MKKHFLITFCILSLAIMAQSQTKVACIGNSITFGAGIANPDSLSYPAQLGKLLGDKWQVKNFGVSGSTMLRHGNKPYWKQTAMNNAISYNPDMVVIKLGTNDSKNFNWKFKDEFEQNYLDMIDTLQALPSHPRILICFPVPAYGNQWAINDSVIFNEIIPIVKQVALKRNLTTIDLYTALSNFPHLFPDKIHPNYLGAALIAFTVSKSIKKEVKLMKKEKRKQKSKTKNKRNE